MRICDLLTIEDPASNSANFQTGFRYLNIIGFILVLIETRLSILWIMMGKGSKAWYERYEAALSKIERDADYITKDVSQMNNRECMHGSLPEPKTMDNNLLSTNGGKFSPSRINIHIGQLSLIVFVLAYVVQMIFYGIIAKTFCCELVVSVLGLCLSFCFRPVRAS